MVSVKDLDWRLRVLEREKESTHATVRRIRNDANSIREEVNTKPSVFTSFTEPLNAREGDLWQPDKTHLRVFRGGVWVDVEGLNAITVVIHSTNGDVFRNGQIQTVLTARVFSGRDEIDLDGTMFIYRWYKTDNAGVPDWVWNTQHQHSFKSFTLTKNDVDNRASFTCEIILNS